MDKETHMPELALYLLGTPRLERDGAPVHVGRAKVVALLAYLAVSGQSQAREALVTLLSPELDTRHARSEFRRTLSVLNRILGPGYLRATRETVAVCDVVGPLAAPDGTPHALGGRGLWVDVARFRACLAPCQAEIHPPGPRAVCAACAPRLQEAVALYRDDFMAGFTLSDSLAFEEWQFFEAEELRSLLSDALQRLCGWHRAQRPPEFEPAITYARRWLALDLLHEPAHRQLMTLYAESGRRAAALRQYRQCLRALEEELGVTPSGETTALYERIRARELAQEEGSPAAASVAVLVSTPFPAFLSDETPPALGERPLFVARERELARLDGLLATALEGQGQITFITGGPGRGKTALMEAFARRAMDAHPELLVVAGHCNAYSGVGDPYLPFRQALSLLSGDVEARYSAGGIEREHARRLWEALPLTVAALLAHGAPLIDTLLPGPALLSRATARAGAASAWLAELRQLTARGSGSSGEGVQSQLFAAYEQVVRKLAGRHPLLLLLDDLQWIDSASTGLLFHLGRELTGARILILAAYRPEEVALGRDGERHPLEKVLAELKRAFGDVRLDLTQADEKEGRRFVDAFLDSEPNQLLDSFRRALHAHTGGHPLFTIELLRAMQARGDLVPDAQGRWVEGPALDWNRLPARVEGVIQARVGRLDDELREILSIASVEGESFTVQVLAAVQDSDPRQLLRALSGQLEGRHRLVREMEPLDLEGQWLYRYRFSHRLFQQYLYNELSKGERALLHREVAQALETLYQAHTGAVAVPLAGHYAQAGVAEKAIHYALQAGDQARMAYAVDEATAHYRVALAFQKEMRDHHGAARTLMKLGLTHHNAFQFEAARQVYDEGFSLWQRAVRIGSARTLPPAPHALRLIFSRHPNTLDPTMCFDADSQLIIDQLFSGLLELTPELEAVPDIARRWEVSSDGCRYLFHLRDDVCWSDGAPVTAADFEFACQRMLDPTTASVVASLLYDIQGARAFHHGEIQDPDSLGVRTPDRLTLELTLEAPAAYFPLLMTMLCPAPRHVVARHGEAWAQPGHIVTSGPFRLQSWRPDGAMVLVRNPDYHGRFPGNVERVELAPGPQDRSLTLQMYEEDRLDVISVPNAVMDRALQRHPGEYLSIPRLITDCLGFSVRKPPFDDRRVRRAFVLATDRERLVAAISPRRVSPATGGLVPPGMPGHAPGIALPYDPAQARHLLASAGYTGSGGRRFPQVEFVYWEGPRADIRAGELARQWRENLGIEILPKGLPGPDFFNRFKTDPPDMYSTGWTADYPDPDNFLRVFLAWRAPDWQDAAYERLIAQARVPTDQAARMALYHRAERILAEEAPIVPLDYQQALMLLKPWVKGYPYTRIRRGICKYVIIEPH